MDDVLGELYASAPDVIVPPAESHDGRLHSATMNAYTYTDVRLGGVPQVTDGRTQTKLQQLRDIAH